MSNLKLISLAFATAINVALIFSCSNVDTPELPRNSSSSAIYPRDCSGGWDDNTEFCFNSENVYRKCSNEAYNPTEEGCCNDSKYILSTHGCENDVLRLRCGTDIYDPETQVCTKNGVFEIGQISGSGIFIDARDGKEYKYETSTIGRVWMANNLNYSKNNTLGWCYTTTGGTSLGTAGADLPGCNNGYGRAYTYEIAIDGNPPRGLCPKGWHVPTIQEWEGAKNGMSSEFYSLRAGNFNSDINWDVGWRDRNAIGFYWTSEGSNNHFQINSTSSIVDNVEAKTTTWPVNHFSVRCIMD